jgi:hypothetical protein
VVIPAITSVRIDITDASKPNNFFNIIIQSKPITFFMNFSAFTTNLSWSAVPIKLP